MRYLILLALSLAAVAADHPPLSITDSHPVQREQPKADPVASAAAALLEIRRIQEDASSAQMKAYEAWMHALDLQKVIEPAVGPDPRKSEIEKAAQAHQINTIIDAIVNAANNGHMEAMLQARDNLKLLGDYRKIPTGASK